MTMTQGVSHKQEFFELQIFSRQNWPKPEFNAKGQTCAWPQEFRISLKILGKNTSGKPIEKAQFLLVLVELRYFWIFKVKKS